MDEALANIKNEKLRSFIMSNAYERGHSAGEEEVNMIAHGWRMIYANSMNTLLIWKLWQVSKNTCQIAKIVI